MGKRLEGLWGWRNERGAGHHVRGKERVRFLLPVARKQRVRGTEGNSRSTSRSSQRIGTMKKHEGVAAVPPPAGAIQDHSCRSKPRWSSAREDLLYISLSIYTATSISLSLLALASSSLLRFFLLFILLFFEFPMRVLSAPTPPTLSPPTIMLFLLTSQVWTSKRAWDTHIEFAY